jgi:DNA-binding IscR family transcriptional regulator
MGDVKVSTRGDYASRALLSLALHDDREGPTSVRDIAERTGLPQPYLEQILLALKGAGLVRSKRGVGGGYVLCVLLTVWADVGSHMREHLDSFTLADIAARAQGLQASSPILT